MPAVRVSNHQQPSSLHIYILHFYTYTRAHILQYIRIYNIHNFVRTLYAYNVHNYMYMQIMPAL